MPRHASNCPNGVLHGHRLLASICSFTLLVRRDFLESMVDLAGAGRTVLLSSHQVAEVERVASHVALLHHGRLILAEPLDDLRARTFVLTLTFNTRDHPLSPPAELPIELKHHVAKVARG